MIRIHLILLALSFGYSAFAEVMSFSFTSKDAKAQLSGVLTYPPSSKTPQNPLVIMVPGSGLFDKDVHFGSSKTDKDLLFVEIEQRLLKEGFAVLRMNYRGVSCNMWNYEGKCTTCTPQEQAAEYLKQCLDFKIRGEVTPENMRDDFEQIYKWSVLQKNIDKKRVIMFGHSEGSTHIARLIEQRRVSPQALIFLGGVTESLDSLIHWQMVERLVDNLLLMDQNGDGEITNEEIQAEHKKNVLSIYPIQALLSPTGSWTKDSFEQLMKEQYNAMKKDALSKDETLPYPNEKMTHASYRWWKMFFTKGSPILKALSSFKGPIFYHNGDLDSQTSASRQKGFIDTYTGPKPKSVSFVIHQKRGHALGMDPLFGPIADDSMDILIRSFTDALKESR